MDSGGRALIFAEMGIEVDFVNGFKRAIPSASVNVASRQEASGGQRSGTCRKGLTHFFSDFFLVRAGLTWSLGHVANAINLD